MKEVMHMGCDKNGCNKPATHWIKFDRYKGGTPAEKACEYHADWWIVGAHGVTHGTMIPMTTKERALANGN